MKSDCTKSFESLMIKIEKKKRIRTKSNKQHQRQQRLKRNGINVQTKPHEANEFKHHCFTRSTGLTDILMPRNTQVFNSRTIQMVLIKYVNFNLIRLQHAVEARIM